MDELVAFIWGGDTESGPRDTLLNISASSQQLANEEGAYRARSGRVRTPQSQEQVSQRLRGVAKKSKAEGKSRQTLGDARFLSPTRSYQSSLDLQRAKQRSSKTVDGVPRFGPNAPHQKQALGAESPGVGRYSPLDTGSIEAKARAAAEAGKRRPAPSSPRSRVAMTADDMARQKLRAGRSGWVSDSAGAGATVPLRLGHEQGLAGKKPIITGRCTFNG